MDTIADLKTRLESKVHGSYSSVTDVDGLIAEAARNVLLMIDPMETKRVTQLSNAIYDKVYSYALPADLKGDKILDIRPQGDRLISDTINQTYSKNFSTYKDADTFAIEMNSGVKTISLNKPQTPAIVLNTCDSLTDNGTWSVGGDGASLSIDTLNKISGSGSLKFNMSAAGSSAYIENSTVDAQDLTTILNDGALFVWVYIPDTDAVTSVSLRWGSSSANYFSATVTASQDNTVFITGWNLLRFDWNGATETGTVDETAIDYLRVTVAYDGTLVNSVRVDSIVAQFGKIYELVYYSKYLFKSAAGVWQEEPLDDGDLINLDVEGRNLLLYECCYLVGQEFGGEDSSFDTNYWEGKRNEAWKKYMQTYKTERRKPQVSYYRR